MKRKMGLERFLMGTTSGVSTLVVLAPVSAFGGQEMIEFFL